MKKQQKFTWRKRSTIHMQGLESCEKRVAA